MGILTRKGGNGARSCHICGATRTLRGQPLTGNYCSPTCLDRARSRPDSHGANQIGRGRDSGIRLSDEDDSGRAYNPFADLFGNDD